MRSYSDEDLPLLQEAFSQWIKTAGYCGYDHVGELPHRIYENLRGRMPVGDLVHIWEEGSEVVGLAINMRFGSAFDVFVAPHLRGSEFEHDLLRSASETTGRLASSDEDYVSTDVFNCDISRIELLTSIGFEHFRTWCDVRECHLSDDIPQPVLPDGFEMRTARLSDADGLANARNHSFDEDWTGVQYRTQVMQKPGYDLTREVIATSPSGEVAAFAVYWVDELNKIGHFEPVGVHSAFRRRGLARSVMLHAMSAMAAQGVTLVTISHDVENEAAKCLYESIGFTKRFETYGFRRRIDRGQ